MNLTEEQIALFHFRALSSKLRSYLHTLPLTDTPWSHPDYPGHFQISRDDKYTVLAKLLKNNYREAKPGPTTALVDTGMSLNFGMDLKEDHALELLVQECWLIRIRKPRNCPEKLRQKDDHLDPLFYSWYNIYWFSPLIFLSQYTRQDTPEYKDALQQIDTTNKTLFLAHNHFEGDLDEYYGKYIGKVP